MTLKRVLVLVMALIMVVSTCATPVLAAFNPETHHEHLHDVIDNPEYKEQYEEIKSTVEDIVKDIEENHEEYYSNGYEYALENGYIATAIEVIGTMLETIPQIELDNLGLTPELQGKLETELDALVPTLEKLEAILVNGEAEDFDGFIKAALTLEGDLYLHMNNVYAILEQGSIEVNQFVLVPVFYEATAALDAMVDAFVEAVVDYVVETVTPYYNMAVETYEAVVATIVKINLFVEDAIEVAVEKYYELVEKLVEIYDYLKDLYENKTEEEEEEVVVPEQSDEEKCREMLEWALKTAYEIYNNVLDTIIKINAKVEMTIEKIGNTINAIIDAYEYTVALLVRIYGTVEKAVIVAHKVYNYVVGLVIRNIELIKAGVNEAKVLLAQVYADILEMVTNAPGEANSFANYMAAQLAAYITGILCDLDAFISDTYYHTFNGSYELKDDSAYVALGNSPFGAALAEKLNLSNKYTQIDMKDNYLDAVAGADLVTIKVDNGEFLAFANQQVNGAVAAIVRNNERLMEFYNHPVVGGYVQEVVTGFGIDVTAQADTLDWSKYFAAEDIEVLEGALALMREKLLEQGVPEYYYIDLQPLVDEALEENGLAGLPGISITMDPIEVPVADLVIYTIESAIYSYVRYTNDLNGLLDSIYAVAPGATVVLLGIDNPLAGLDFDFAEYGIDCITFADCLAVAESVVAICDAQLIIASVKNENTIFVLENDADAIFEAIHMYCDHVYDDCLDTICDRCLGERVAPGHDYAYTSNGDATCTANGTKTGVCVNCGDTYVCEDEGSMLPHDYSPATCTSPKTCKDCGATEGSKLAHNYEAATCTKPRTCKDCGVTDGKALGHNYSSATCEEPKTCRRCGATEGGLAEHKFGDWKTVTAATKKTTGCEERTCRVCGLVQSRVIPVIPPKYTPGTIVAVVISAFLFSIAILTIILWRLRKQNLLK